MKEIEKKLIGKDLPSRIAFKDISEYIRSLELEIIDKNGDVWVVTPNRMANKDTRKLNLKLGVHKLNKQK